MLFLLVVALMGASALKSDTTTVTDWVKGSSASFWEATVTPTIPYPDGRYVVDGAKVIRWDGIPRRPEGIVFVPTGMENRKKADAPAPLKKPRGKAGLEGFNLPIIPALERTTSAGPDSKKSQEKVTDLGILDQKSRVSGVNTDEILSYFQKANITTEQGNEETGAILNADANGKLDQAPPSSATFESQ